MTDRVVQNRLNRAMQRVMRVQLWTGFGLIWLTVALLGALLLWFGVGPANPRDTARWLLLGGMIASLLWMIRVISKRRDDRRAARLIESRFPGLDAALLTAIEQEETPIGKAGYLQQEVLDRVRRHSDTHNWSLVVSARRMTAALAINLLGLLAATAVFVGLAQAPSAIASLPEEPEAPESSIAQPRHFDVIVEPGDTEVERGTSLLVLARFPNRVPEEASLRWTEPNAEFEADSPDEQAPFVTLIEPMDRSLDDPVFAARIDAVRSDLTYSVEFGDQSSDTYQVTVFDYPRLEQADAKLQYPDYTGREDRVVQDIRRLTILRGTTVDLTFRLNKPVTKAMLVGDNDQSIDIAVDAEQPLATLTTQLDESAKYRLVLTDEKGRQNKVPPQFTFTVVDNSEPKLKMIRPKRDVPVSPIEELDIHATVWDDFELKRAGVTYSIAGQPNQDIVLSESIPAKKNQDLTYRVLLEQLNAEPDQLLSYYFWAEDIGPEGETRRTLGDMFFAEVRPFEEIYRQGDPPPSGQGQPQQADELAELQKQIISAAWKVLRRETRSELSDEFAKDSELLVSSQTEAITLLEEVMTELTDARSRQFAGEAMTAMERARDQFDLANSTPSADPLNEGLASAQLAYQGLLKLRAREHRIARAQQSQGQGGGRRNQDNLNDLELDEEENRYETQTTASPEETAEQQEDRQVLSRLRELARRQDDLNERIKELQSALEQAESEQERAEIERQLKRLREEQQQILRDAEELAERMDQPDNQQRMSEQREQLDEARENARRASEALQEGQVSRAAAEGTRAEETLNELKDEFQKRTAGALAAQLRDLQDQAEELAEREQELADKLAGSEKPAERPSLRPQRSNDQSESLDEEFEQQRQRITDLTREMREAVEEAENADQTLLAEKLYDAIRSTRQRPPQEALSLSEASLRRGFVEDAQKLERIANDGIETLREGINEAAESVLQDDTESLRRARQRLQRLRNDLDSEIARNDPNPQQSQSPASERGEQQNGEQQNGEQRNGEQQNGEQQGSGTRGQQQDVNNERSANEQQQDGQRSPSGPREEAGQQSDQEQQGQRSEQQQGQQQAGQQREQGDQQGQQGQQQGQQEGQQGQQGERGQQGQSGQQGQQQGQQEGQQGERGQQGQQGQGGQRGQSGQQGQQAGNQPGQSDSPGSPQQGRNGSRQPRSLSDGQRTQQTRNTGGRNWGGGEDREFMDRTNRNPAPIAGDDYLDWSDQLRDVEELLSDPDLRAEAAGIRDRAKEIRKEIRRHSADPNWDIIREMVADPLADLERQVTSELLRRTSDELVPIDRKPIPAEFEARVREYYERLGVGR